MLRRTLWVLLGLVLILARTPVHAGVVMAFEINLSGIDSVSGTSLRVFGGLFVDPTMPISSAITSELFFQRNSDPPDRLPFVPGIAGAVSSNLRWQLIEDDLYIVRTGQENASIVWETPTALGRRRPAFYLGSGTGSHFIRFDLPPVLGTDIAILKLASGPDEPNGFFLGTAVPEPTSFFLMSLSGALLSFRRRRTI